MNNNEIILNIKIFGGGPAGLLTAYYFTQYIESLKNSHSAAKKRYNKLDKLNMTIYEKRPKGYQHRKQMLFIENFYTSSSSPIQYHNLFRIFRNRKKVQQFLPKFQFGSTDNSGFVVSIEKFEQFLLDHIAYFFRKNEDNKFQFQILYGDPDYSFGKDDYVFDCTGQWNNKLKEYFKPEKLGIDKLFKDRLLFYKYGAVLFIETEEPVTITKKEVSQNRFRLFETDLPNRYYLGIQLENETDPKELEGEIKKHYGIREFKIISTEQFKYNFNNEFYLAKCTDKGRYIPLGEASLQSNFFTGKGISNIINDLNNINVYQITNEDFDICKLFNKYKKISSYKYAIQFLFPTMEKELPEKRENLYVCVNGHTAYTAESIGILKDNIHVQIFSKYGTSLCLKHDGKECMSEEYYYNFEKDDCFPNINIWVEDNSNHFISIFDDEGTQDNYRLPYDILSNLVLPENKSLWLNDLIELVYYPMKLLYKNITFKILGCLEFDKRFSKFNEIYDITEGKFVFMKNEETNFQKQKDSDTFKPKNIKDFQDSRIELNQYLDNPVTQISY